MENKSDTVYKHFLHVLSSSGTITNLTEDKQTRPLPCLHRLQEGLQHDLARSFVGNHEEVQYQHKPYPNHQKPL